MDAIEQAVERFDNAVEEYYTARTELLKLITPQTPAERATKAEDVLDQLIDIIRVGKHIKHGTPDAAMSLMIWYQKLTALIAEWKENKNE